MRFFPSQFPLAVFEKERVTSFIPEVFVTQSQTIENCQSRFSNLKIKSMEVIQRNKLRMRKLAATAQSFATSRNARLGRLETALMECIFKKDETGLPESYGPASYFPLIPENSEQKFYMNKRLSMVRALCEQKDRGFHRSRRSGNPPWLYRPKGHSRSVQSMGSLSFSSSPNRFWECRRSTGRVRNGSCAAEFGSHRFPLHQA